jgi:tripartite-type tricarboxylate transporter receptor subunit TctC
LVEKAGADGSTAIEFQYFRKRPGRIFLAERYLRRHSPTLTLPFLKSGKLRVLGVSTAKRPTFMPDVPTIAEAGVPNYEVNSWSALFAPAGSPPAILTSINAEIGKGLRQADALEVLEKQGLEQSAGTQEELASLIKAEVAKWTKVMKATGIEPI